MPEIEDHVTNLELSRKLKAAGVRGRSLFEWCIFDTLDPKVRPYSLTFDGAKEMIPAWTASELGAMLPRSITYDGLDFYYEQQSLTDLAYVHHYNGEEGRIPDAIFTVTGTTTEADARARLLLWLIDEGHVTLDEKAHA